MAQLVMAKSPAQILPVVVSLMGLVVLWAAAATIGDDPTILPSPGAVWHILVGEIASGEWQDHMVATTCRVAAAFALAMSFGTALGLVMGLNETINRWLSAWLLVLLNIPALVVIVLCYLWIGLNEVAAITAVALNKTAMVAVTIREGVQARDVALADMAQVFGMRRRTYLRHVLWPQLWPFAVAAIRNGLAIIWKIVLVVEFLGRSNGVGFQIHLYFQLFETGNVLAYALSFTGLMLLVDFGLIRVMESRAKRWRAVAT